MKDNFNWQCHAGQLFHIFKCCALKVNTDLRKANCGSMTCTAFIHKECYASSDNNTSNLFYKDK
jgi:hypothetical protein